MFGLKIAIGAVDNTTGALRSIGGNLKKFSRNVRTWLNLAGFTMIARQIGSALDSAFKASSYADEWGKLKKMMSESWTNLGGKIADVLGPFMGDIETLNVKLLEGVDAWIDRIRYAAAYWKRALPTALGGAGESMDVAAVGAESDLKAAKEADARRKEAAANKAYNQMIQDAADKFALDEEIRKRNIARKIPEQAEYTNTGIFVDGKEWNRKVRPKFDPRAAYREASLSEYERTQATINRESGRTIGEGINAWRPRGTSFALPRNILRPSQIGGILNAPSGSASGDIQSSIAEVADNTRVLLEIMQQSFTPNKGP